jgi:hypothetical protein
MQALARAAGESADADVLLINSSVDGDLDRRVIKLVLERHRRANVMVVITTEGGSADQAFRMARCFQACYSKYTAVVGGFCKSAGTLLCIGAHDLQMGDLAELGPLDVQLAKPDELGLISSGLTHDSSFRSLQAAAFQMFESFLLDIITKSGGRITTKTAAELSVRVTTGLFSPIFEQMDPMKIGEDYRSARVAEQYALRLNAHALNLLEPSSGVEALVRGYPSHGFVIDRTEAKALFRRVAAIEPPLLELVRALGPNAAMPRAKNGKSGTKTPTQPGNQPPSDKQPPAGPGKSLSANLAKGDGNVPIQVPKRSPGSRDEDPAPA